MKIKWKLFRESFPHICDKCGALANTEREFCETCGAPESLRVVTKADYAVYLAKIK